MKRCLSFFMACAAVGALGVAPITAQGRAPYSGIVVFGTSLSDTGNAFALAGTHGTPPDFTLSSLLVPGAPYARGGHHFTNGATWIEQLARSMGLAGSVRPAFASNGVKATNYAVGGARAYADGKNVNLGDQVQAFLADHAGAADPDALYVIEMGGNDLRDAINAYVTPGQGPAAANTILQQAIGSIAENIRVLYDAGARHFLVWLPPNVALTPALQMVAQMNPAIVALGTGLTQAFIGGLGFALNQLSALPGIDITILDAYTLLNAITADPGAFGFTNVQQACVSPNDPPFHCQAADEYLFWDGIHPTTAGHAVTAQEAARVLGR